MEPALRPVEGYKQGLPEDESSRSHQLDKYFHILSEIFCGIFFLPRKEQKMVRLPRAVLANVPHHLTQCGNRRENIFFTDPAETGEGRFRPTPLGSAVAFVCLPVYCGT